MAAYGVRVKDANAVVTLDTTISTIRSLVTKTITVPTSSAIDQYIAMPEITANSFVCVELVNNTDGNLALPAVFWTTGQLQVRRGSGANLYVHILTYQ